MTITDLELKLLRLAEDLDVRVEDDIGQHLQRGHLGGWFPDERLILIRTGLGPRNRIHTLAHELGHAASDDPAGHQSRYEMRADLYAANLLINPQEYAELEMIYDGHPGAIAAELGVTIHLLEVWQATRREQFLSKDFTNA
ncbi:ImmA/IrrE family metallo-endopeptidase [Corynebacterium sp. Q4381]|uniref:ImmA/IrrE family metallo-endopeptidase n=1 Tax=Corynebacterium sp. Marseille-Q4381 TaxID=3121597 RepID=UPI002FE53184